MGFVEKMNGRWNASLVWKVENGNEDKSVKATIPDSCTRKYSSNYKGKVSKRILSVTLHLRNNTD